MIDDHEFTTDGLPGTDEEIGRDIATDDVVTVARTTVRRRIVTKTDQNHVAQDMIMATVLGLLEKLPENETALARLVELGVSVEEFGPVMAKQVARVAKLLKFELAQAE